MDTFLKLATSINTRIEKELNLFRKGYDFEVHGPRQEYERFLVEKYKPARLHYELKSFGGDCRLSCQLRDIWIRETRPPVAWFVTIRPPPGLVDLPTFCTMCRNLLACENVIDWECSLEQKGTSEATLGTGVHLHAILTCSAKWEQKANLINTLSHMFAVPTTGVDVKSIRETERLRAYLTSYESADGHKEETKTWDALWRDKVGLLPYYSRSDGAMPSVVDFEV